MFIGIPYVSCAISYEFRAETQTTCLQFDVFLTVHHSIDSFKLPT